MKRSLRDFLKEDEGIDEPKKKVDYEEISETLDKLIKLFKSVEDIPHPGELSTEIKILKTFEDKIDYLKKYNKTGKW